VNHFYPGRDLMASNRSRMRLKRFRSPSRKSEVNRLRMYLEKLTSPVLVQQCFDAILFFEKPAKQSASNAGGDGKRVLDVQTV
jgi:hypothetical protein